MSQALYRKYRSRTFDEVIGQNHITDTLKAAVKGGRLSHAYLFTGPHGVGKTSVARILAHTINGLDYSADGSHLDIIEIDGASHNGVEDIRDLREKVHVVPSSGKYKVYVIDEVHMLSKGAFNALLKTLEEPPEHVVFILATTEAHKLPETIISRTQRFTFRPVAVDEVAAHLATIAKKEKIKVEPEALRILAEHGGGSFRDSISLLDQLQTGGQPVTAELVRDRLGLPPADVIDELCQAVISAQPRRALELLEQLKAGGTSPATIAKNLGDKLRIMLVDAKLAPEHADLLAELLEVPVSPSPQDRLEICLLSASSKEAQTDSQPGADEIKIKAARSGSEPDFHSSLVTSKPKPTTAKSCAQVQSLDSASWQKILKVVQAKDSALGMALKHAGGRTDNANFELVFEFPLYKKKAGSAANRTLIAEVINEVLGADLKVSCLVDKDAYHELATQFSPQANSASLQTISNIFGGGEVLESQV